MTHILACVLPHQLGYCGSLGEVVSSVFGLSREFIQRGADPEDNGTLNLHKISRIVEECRIVVMDERESGRGFFGVRSFTLKSVVNAK